MDLRGQALLVGLKYGIGDVVMEFPILQRLRRVARGAHLTAVGAHPAIELLADHSLVDEVVGLEAWGITHRWDAGDDAVRASLREWFGARHFDLCLDINQLPPVVGEVVRELGMPMRQADGAAERAAVRAGANAIEAIQAAVRAGWGEEFAVQGQPRLTCSQPERQEAERFLHEKGLVGQPLVGICPVASLELKRWPFERFLNVADWILAESACSVLFFCGPHPELAARAKARVRDGDRLACVERLHLRAVAALVERCQAFLCNDTGLSHIAAALEIPTVTIFGITDPRVYQPPGPGTASVGGTVSCPHRNTRSLEPPLCFFAGRCLIANQGCITSVREAEVLRALEEMLQSSLGARVPHPSAAAQRPAQMGG